MLEKIAMAACIVIALAALAWMVLADRECTKQGGVLVRQAIGLPTCVQGR